MLAAVQGADQYSAQSEPSHSLLSGLVCPRSSTGPFLEPQLAPIPFLYGSDLAQDLPKDPVGNRLRAQIKGIRPSILSVWAEPRGSWHVSPSLRRPSPSSPSPTMKTPLLGPTVSILPVTQMEGARTREGQGQGHTEEPGQGRVFSVSSSRVADKRRQSTAPAHTGGLLGLTSALPARGLRCFLISQVGVGRPQGSG